MDKRNAFARSAAHLKDLRSLTVIAMLLAMNLALNSVDIQITPELRIAVGFLTNAAAAMLFGPVVSVTMGAMTDILACILFPKGAYFPGFTLTAMVGGLIYGLCLYGRQCSFWRALTAKGLVNLICNVGLNTLWLSMLQGKAMTVLWPARLLKNALLWPLESLLLFVVCQAVWRVYAARGGKMDT